MLHDCDIAVSFVGPSMKKHLQADALAARLTDAANKPPAILPFPTAAPAEVESATVTATVEPESHSAPADESKRRKRRKTRTTEQFASVPEDDTVPISLRPHRDLLMRYVIAASERARETGRVVSAQQIMLERLDGGP
jgi:hypothetical protein